MTKINIILAIEIILRWIENLSYILGGEKHWIDMEGNLLYYGDNLDILRRHIKDEVVDLIYLDPPFNSNRSYNILFDEKNGSQSASQIRAFEDTWHWNLESQKEYENIVSRADKVSDVMQAFMTFLGSNDLMAYLAMMAPRLIELHRVLRSTGSIYLHCDPTANHYLKILMDSVFGTKNFRNEIIWYYYNKIHDYRKNMFPNAADTILFYAKDINSDFTYHQLKEMRDEPIKQLRRKKVNGKMVNVKNEEGHVIYRMKSDRTIDNIWRIPCLQHASTERLGFPTQKPQTLLERIIKASSNEGDLILDPFCGCGTAISAAQHLNRRWIGIDITYLAITLIKTRLKDAFGDDIEYKVIGEPVSLSDANELAKQDPYQFQWWALGLVGARPVERKKGSDKGIDGRILFFESPSDKKAKQIIISVKSGKVSPMHIRDLKGVVEREKAAIGVYITLNAPTRDINEEAANAGFYKSIELSESIYPKIQILTIEGLLNGKKILSPVFMKSRNGNITFKQAPKDKKSIKKEKMLPTLDEFT